MEFTDGNIKDASVSANYDPLDSSIADVVKGSGRADVVFKKLGYTELEASLQGCQQRVEIGTCEPLAGGGRYCECDCEPSTVTVPGYFGLSPSAQVLFNQVETDEMVVVAWLDKTPISLPSGANPNNPPGSGTPWIWSAIKFNADGTFAPLDHQIFPTYYVYRNGALIQTFPQSAPTSFIPLTSASQRSPGQIN